MSEKNILQRKHKKGRTYIMFIVIGILMTIISEFFTIRNPRMYTFGGLIARPLSRVIIYFIILGSIALIVSIVKKNIRKYWFPILAWLFLIAGIFDITIESFNKFVLRPQIEELVRNGKLEDTVGISDVLMTPNPQERLFGHWASEDDYTHLYFAPNKMVIVNLGIRKNVVYEIIDANQDEAWIQFSVSGADYVPHTRTMYFQNNGLAWQVVEMSEGAYKSKLKYISSEQSPS